MVTILGRWNAVLETLELILRWVESVAPGLERKRWIGDDKVKGLQSTVLLLEVRTGEHVVLPDFRGRAVVQDHVHFGQRRRSVVHFLPVEGQVESALALGFVVRLEQ